jgi:hypothetical protein
MGRFGKNIDVGNQWMTANRFTAKLMQSRTRLLVSQHSYNSGSVATGQFPLTRAVCGDVKWTANCKDLNRGGVCISGLYAYATTRPILTKGCRQQFSDRFNRGTLRTRR